MVNSIALPRLMTVGGGALGTAAQAITTLGIRRPMVISDQFMERNGYVERLREILGDDGIDVGVFCETVPDPTTDSLIPGLTAVAEHRADGLIGFGGGSAIDTAKALAVLALNSEPMQSYKAPNMYSGPALPLIAIPTTAGSGSEVTRVTVITDSATQEKMLCGGPSFQPLAAVVDYELTLSMPARLTADTGVDALTHAVEAYVSRKANAFTDALCLTAISTIAANIRRVYEDGADLPAREAMMLAATQAGMAFSNSSVALIHGMSRPIGGHFHVAHGLSNAMLFPVVTRYSVAGSPERYADCARAMNLATPQDDTETAVSTLINGIVELCGDLEVPTPKTYGISRTEWEQLLPVMAREALASGSPANNPLIPDAETITELYIDAYQ